MEVFTPPPYKEKRPIGRAPKLTVEARLLVGQKVLSKDMTYVEATKTFGISQGAVSNCIKFYQKQSVYKKKNERNAERNVEIDDYRHKAELKALKQEIADLYLENQLLKKLINRSAQQKKLSGSVITSENLDQLKRGAE